MIPAQKRTFYFIGVTTGASSIMRVFPKWAAHLGLGDVAIKGIDLKPHDTAENYRAVTRFIKEDPLSLGALVTTWVTFAPCFLWIFLGAPFIERLRDNVALTGAMTAITAAVVGVIMNLAIWFSIHALFGEVTTWRGLGTEIELPVFHTLDPVALALTAAAVIAVFGFKVGMIKVLLACALMGAALFA